MRKTKIYKKKGKVKAKELSRRQRSFYFYSPFCSLERTDQFYQPQTSSFAYRQTGGHEGPSRAAVRHGLQETLGSRRRVDVWKIFSAIVRT